MVKRPIVDESKLSNVDDCVVQWSPTRNRVSVECIRNDATLDGSVARFILVTLQSALPNETVGKILSTREFEVLELLASGLTKKEIAAKLHLSPSTISTHVVHIFEKLDVQNAPAAVAQAFRLGIFRQ